MINNPYILISNPNIRPTNQNLQSSDPNIRISDPNIRFNNPNIRINNPNMWINNPNILITNRIYGLIIEVYGLIIWIYRLLIRVRLVVWYINKAFIYDIHSTWTKETRWQRKKVWNVTSVSIKMRWYQNILILWREDRPLTRGDPLRQLWLLILRIFKPRIRTYSALNSVCVNWKPLVNLLSHGEGGGAANRLWCPSNLRVYSVIENVSSRSFQRTFASSLMRWCDPMATT